MHRKPLFWFVVSAMCLAGAAYFWHLGDQWQAEQRAAKPAAHLATASFVTPKSRTVAPVVIGSNQLASAKIPPVKSRYPYRLSNTTQSTDKLVHNGKAILLMNAQIDTSKPINFAIPDRLRAAPNSGSYIVQANGPLNDQFRAALQAANATIVSYIPNNAYLVRVSDAGAQQLSAVAQSVLPFEPYYKLDPSLLKMAVEQPDSMPPNGVNVTLFPDAYDTAMTALKSLGADVVSQDRSPFGQVVKAYLVPGTLSTVASLPGVQAIAPAHARVQANDLMRPTLGVSFDSVVPTNYLNLTGSNVLLSINDFGVDKNHPDLTGRLTSDFPFALADSNGHGTHVAGTILGSGSESPTVTFAQGSVSNANFRGMAFNANAFVMSIEISSDSYLQEQAARTNAFISNNSWNYQDSDSYDIQAASYDAAVRDALPEVTGSQPLLYVFSAGDAGGGQDNGTGGSPDSILSPATAKNVITVGAIELPRGILSLTTNNVKGTNVITTNSIFLGETDSGNQVAAFSSRGNVGVNIEGSVGRFKPDVVAPGTFVISDRSTTWDTAAYYDPTNFTVETGADVVPTNAINAEVITPSLPNNIVGITFSVSANSLSTNFPPNLPIYVGVNQTPTATVFDLMTTSNSVTLPAGSVTLNPGDSITFSVGNSTNGPVAFDWTLVLITTNDDGLFTALSNVNNGLAPFYRYESGTSMSAAGISGTLALMQEFFQQRLQLTNSPALMKALLINGSRSLGQPYDLSPGAANGNFQGWGLPNLQNIIPPTLATFTPATQTSFPVMFLDQNPTNALATGQSNSRLLALSPDGQNQDLRITLVWTDPPGNPAAGTKLVNDLDLIVSNTVTGDVFFGNDIPGGSVYSESWDTNGPPNLDSVNNVENVFLRQPLGSNYVITVLGQRVNVNAVTANTNGIVQDYALVVSSGDAGGVATPFTQFTDLNASGPSSNTFGFSTNFSANMVASNAVPLFNQRVGANSQFSGGTNGTLGQWNFYVYTNPSTNAPSFTNVAIVTFQSPNLGVVRMGASEEDGVPADGANPAATRDLGADIDLYVSQDPTLTNLNPAAIALAFKSTTRTGAEKVLLTNSAPGQVYYIGVKSEDQEAAQFNLFAVAINTPFDQGDGSNNVLVTIITPFPIIIPGGAPGSPSHGLVLGVSTSSAQARKVTVTNNVTHQEFGDLIGTLTHGQASVVLNNHSFFTNVADTTETFVYDDSGENTPGARNSDGPGSLRDFVGDVASDGVWMFTMVNDSSLSDTGQINNFAIAIDPQPTTNGFPATIGADSWFFDFVDVPVAATNLTITVTGNSSPVDLFVKAGSFPTNNLFDEMAVLIGTNDSLSINKFQSPPLNAGRYFYGIFNPNPTAQNVFITVEVDQSLTPLQPLEFPSVGNEPLLDDAVTDSTNHVGNTGTVADIQVGVRIDHPRESDLVLTLISPSGTRVLLAENRGGLDTNGYGSGVNVTNVLPTTTSGTQASETNNVFITNSVGTLVINYDFLNVPDDMRIFDGSTLLFDSGLVNQTGTFQVNYGPTASTNLSIVMNAPGTNPSTNGDLWNYTVTVITEAITYATFTEDTNLTTLPIKFATPPFGGNAALLPPVTNFTSSFEGVAAGNFAPASTVDGWTVGGLSNVTVYKLPALADTGSNLLALHTNSISRIMPTIAGQTYTLTFAYHGRAGSMGPVGWWKGEDFNDSSGNNNTLVSVGPGNPSFQPGVVGNAFDFTSPGKLHVADQPIYILTNALTMECWVNCTVVANNEGILQRGDNRNGFDPYLLAAIIPPGPSSQPMEVVFQITDNFANTPFIVVPVPTNQFIHVAGTYLFNSASNLAVMSLYTNGVLATNTTTTFRPLGALMPGQQGGVGIGNTGDLVNNFPFIGLVDEMTLYSNALSAAQVADIFAAGSLGKRTSGDITPVNASVIFGGVTNLISGVDGWTTTNFTFTATSNNMTLELQGLEDGMLVDSFSLVQPPVDNPSNFFLPEESLNKLIGESATGDWILEVLDNRVGATNPTPNLVSWKLNLFLDTITPAAFPLQHGISHTNSLPGNSIAYFIVDVPPWASFATNILGSVNGGPLTLLFDQQILPESTNNAPDFILIPSTTTGGSVTLTTNGVPPLLPGQRYFLGVTNTSPNTATFTMEVDFNITPLTNGIPILTNILAAGNVPRYYQFDVDSNAVGTLFETFNANGNVELVIQNGLPLPTLTSFSYGSDFPGTNNQTIIVATNSTPVPLTVGRWYLGVYNNDTNTVTYSILAQEFIPTIILLTNGVPFNAVATPGPAVSNFFEFQITNSAPGALFEVYSNTGNVDLTLGSNAIPFNAPFFASSSHPSTNREQIVIRTNATMTSLNANWFLGVPNEDSTNVNFTIRAVVSTNGFLPSEIPILLSFTFPPPGSTTGPTLMWPSVQGELYAVEVSPNLVSWTTNAVVSGAGITTSYLDPAPSTNAGATFYRVIQLPTPP